MSPDAPTPPAELQRAKEELWELESALLQAIPAEQIVERWPHLERTRALIPEPTEGRYRWPGAVEVRVAGGFDEGALRAGLAAAWGAHPAWTVEEASPGEPLVLRRDDGVRFSIGLLPGRDVLRIAGLSAAFPLPERDLRRAY